MEETRVAQLGILVEDPDSVEALNACSTSIRIISSAAWACPTGRSR